MLPGVFSCGLLTYKGYPAPWPVVSFHVLADSTWSVGCDSHRLADLEVEMSFQRQLSQESDPL